MAKTVREIHILRGLPGSGKTYFAKNEVDRLVKKNFSNKNKIIHVELDSIKYSMFGSKRSEQDVWSMIYSYLRTAEVAYIDGLFLTNKAVIDFIKKIQEIVSVENLTIHFWNEDREICLYNDNGRRNTPSEVTIKSAEYEKTNEILIKEQTGLQPRVISHYVAKKPEYLYFAAEEGIVLKDNKYLVSDKWHGDGTTRDCDGNSSHLSGSDPLTEFKEFDELLESIYPNISFLAYKKIYNACVTVEDAYDGDYYSSYTSYWFQCDVEKLYEMVSDLGIKNKEPKIRLQELLDTLESTREQVSGQCLESGTKHTEGKVEGLNIAIKEIEKTIEAL